MKLYFLMDSNGVKAHSLLFEMNPKFTLTSDSANADAIVLIPYQDPEVVSRLHKILLPHQFVIVLSVFHAADYMDDDHYEYIRRILPARTIIVQQNANSQTCIHFNIAFLLQKLYSTDYESGKELNARVWTYGCNKETYQLHPLNKKLLVKFLSLSRIYHRVDGPEEIRMVRRKSLREHLSVMSALLSPTNHADAFMPGGDINSILDAQIQHPLSGCWYPVDHSYYDASLVSVYVETVCAGNSVRIITEKTFEPLNRGNFILPFGYAGLLLDIVNFGFKLPDWIDYSYDSIVDDNERFKGFLGSLSALNKIPLRDMYSLYKRDSHILEHNRAVFVNTPYDDLHRKITASAISNGWYAS